MIVVANWKAYVESLTQAKELHALAKRLAKRATIVLAMPHPYLGAFSGSVPARAAQDLSLYESGAHTGEVTAAALSSLGVGYVIIGHSERRAQGESDEVVAKKVQLALKEKLVPVVCIGESVRDEDAKYLAVIRAQLAAVFTPLSQSERARVVIAYEPVWAIGKSSSEAIQPSDLGELVLYIRKVLAEYVSVRVAQKMVILYGGSADAVNARALLEGGGVDGFLVGRASVDPDTFSALVRSIT